MTTYENDADRNAERSVGMMRLIYDVIPAILSSYQGVKLT